LARRCNPDSWHRNAPWRGFLASVGEYLSEWQRRLYRSQRAKQRPPGESCQWCPQCTRRSRLGTLRQGRQREVGYFRPPREGHLNKDTTKDQHAKAIANANAAAEKNHTRKLTHFQPYILRHTALTALVQAGCDAFTLARIAGHSSITITSCTSILKRTRSNGHSPRSLLQFRSSWKNRRTIRWAQNQAQTKRGGLLSPCKFLVRKGGLEPPWVSPPDPKSGASANSATFARLNSSTYIASARFLSGHADMRWQEWVFRISQTSRPALNPSALRAARVR